MRELVLVVVAILTFKPAMGQQIFRYDDSDDITPVIGWDSLQNMIKMSELAIRAGLDGTAMGVAYGGRANPSKNYGTSWRVVITRCNAAE